MIWLLAHLALAADLDSVDARMAVAAHQLEQRPGVYLRWDPVRSWGTSLLINVLDEVAHRVAAELPLADPLLVGDISRRGGGWMPGHITHHVGIDADIGLFTSDGLQPLEGFIDMPSEELDLHANWVLIRALLDTEQVVFILLDQEHIDRMREYVVAWEGLSEEEAEAIFLRSGDRLPWDTRGVLRHAPNHKSHLHVRIQDQPQS